MNCFSCYLTPVLGHSGDGLMSQDGGRVALGREVLMEFVFNVFLIVKHIMCSHVYKTQTFIHI